MRERWHSVPVRERRLLAAAMALGFVVVVAYVVATRNHPLAGDQGEYDLQGHLFTVGKWWWSTTPFGYEHATAWKAPAYPAWVGFWYEVLGRSATRIGYVQACAAPVAVLSTWLLARRLFDPRVAIASAFVVAVFPLSWEFFGLLYPEALAIPLTTLVVYAFVDREPTPRRAVGVGALIGVALLVRPTSFFLFAGVLVAWWIAAGAKRGLLMSGLAVAVAALLVAPWTIRNAIVVDGFVPISVQDAAAYGTFNDVSADDPDQPYAWRYTVLELEDVVPAGETISEAEFRSRLQDRAFDYIADHPESVPKAFFWNGLTRFWDVRRPKWARAEAAPEGRSEAVTTAGLAMYYVLLPLAIWGLWRARGRKQVVLPLLALALSASVVFTVQGGTRYRAPLEPVIAILACSAAVPVLSRRGPTREEPRAGG